MSGWIVRRTDGLMTGGNAYGMLCRIRGIGLALSSEKNPSRGGGGWFKDLDSCSGPTFYCYVLYRSSLPSLGFNFPYLNLNSGAG